MTPRSLDALFAPQTIALIGANDVEGSVGQVLVRNLLGGGFAGQVMLVDRIAMSPEGVEIFRTIGDLPERPDLAVIATPAETIPSIITELGTAGCRVAIVISAGFEGPGHAADLRKSILAAARPFGLRIVGPNCLGFLSPARGVNASFAARMPDNGRVALVAQSGAVAAAALDWAPAHGVGFSHVLTVGDCADVDIADVLAWLATDPETDSVILYIESISDGAKFLAAARTLAQSKPVAVLKSGRSAAGAQAAFSHTGALAGADAVYDAAFRRAGLVRVDSLDALFEAAQVFSAGLHLAGDRLAILTNGGGAGVLAADALDSLGGALAVISQETQTALRQVLPANASAGNPVDILGDAHPALYGAALGILLEAKEVDAVLALNCPTAVADSFLAAEAVIEASERHHRSKPVLTAWLGEVGMAAARARFAAADIASFSSPEAAIAAFSLLGRTRGGRLLAGLSPVVAAQRAAGETAHPIVAEALAQGRGVLTDPEARDVLRAYGIPVVRSLTVPSPEAAGVAASRLGGAVVIKILSRDISHKSDVGGVRLNLHGSAETELAARDMLERVRLARPSAAIDGFVVEPMIDGSQSQELLAGLVRDPTFGPMVMIGNGGTAVEILADRSLGLPPLNDPLAKDMIARTRVSRLLVGYRGRPAADLDALSATLVGLAQLAVDLPEVFELDINPLLCGASGVIAVDARIAVRAPARSPSVDAL